MAGAVQSGIARRLRHRSPRRPARMAMPSGSKACCGFPPMAYTCCTCRVPTATASRSTAMTRSFGTAHMARRKKTAVVNLAHGDHPLAVDYFVDKSPSPFFKLEWEGPGLPRQEIPPAALFHAEGRPIAPVVARRNRRKPRHRRDFGEGRSARAQCSQNQPIPGQVADCRSVRSGACLFRADAEQAKARFGHVWSMTRTTRSIRNEDGHGYRLGGAGMEPGGCGRSQVAARRVANRPRCVLVLRRGRVCHQPENPG